MVLLMAVPVVLGAVSKITIETVNIAKIESIEDKHRRLYHKFLCDNAFLSYDHCSGNFINCEHLDFPRVRSYGVRLVLVFPYFLSYTECNHEAHTRFSSRSYYC